MRSTHKVAHRGRGRAGRRPSPSARSDRLPRQDSLIFRHSAPARLTGTSIANLWVCRRARPHHSDGVDVAALPVAAL
ncbi:hypothetical protein [Azospirillum largimobile]